MIKLRNFVLSILCIIISLVVLNYSKSQPINDDILKPCDDSRVVYILSLNKDSSYSSGHGVVYDKNIILTAKHVVDSKDIVFTYLMVGEDVWKVYPKNIKHIDDMHSFVYAPTNNIKPYKIGILKEDDNIKVNRCHESSKGNVLKINKKLFPSDAYLVPGWSGSPVVNSKNELVGIAQAIIDIDEESNFDGISIMSRVDICSGFKGGL